MAIVARIMLALLLTTGLLAQDPEKPPPAPAPAAEAPKEASPAPAAPAKPVTWDDKTAKETVAQWASQRKGSPSLADRNRALDLFAGGSHKLLIKPLVDTIEDDKSLVVRRRAAELLANQPAKEANSAIRKLLKNPAVASQPSIAGDLIRGLARCGYMPAQWAELDNLFERDYAEDRVPIQEALLDLVTATKEKQALPILLRNLDEPKPENEHDASNPPASYWEARWKSWNVWKGKVKEALFAVTGQRFSTAAEAKAWLKKNPLK